MHTRTQAYISNMDMLKCLQAFHANYRGQGQTQVDRFYESRQQKQLTNT